MSTVYLTRKESFCASHRLHSPSLSDAENKRIFDKCNRPNGHGHNYYLEVTIRGKVDPATGIVFNLTDLKKVIEKTVLSKVDHRHLNLDVPELEGLNPTTEQLAIVFWKWLQAELPKGLLYEVKLYETEKNMAIFRGD